MILLYAGYCAVLCPAQYALLARLSAIRRAFLVDVLYHV